MIYRLKLEAKKQGNQNRAQNQMHRNRKSKSKHKIGGAETGNRYRSTKSDNSSQGHQRVLISCGGAATSVCAGDGVALVVALLTREGRAAAMVAHQ
jgi:hypothetical protein